MYMTILRAQTVKEMNLVFAFDFAKEFAASTFARDAHLDLAAERRNRSKRANALYPSFKEDALLRAQPVYDANDPKKHTDLGTETLRLRIKSALTRLWDKIIVEYEILRAVGAASLAGSHLQRGSAMVRPRYIAPRFDCYSCTSARLLLP